MRGGTTAGAAGAAMALLALAVPAAADGAQPDLSRFYSQRLVWGGCTVKDAPKGMECAELTVPIDYARPEDGTIALAVARVRAAESGEGPTGTGTGAAPARAGAPKGSLVLNFGGPGESGLKGLGDFMADTARLAPAYDLVTFDPRGVGRSAPVRCGAEAEEVIEGSSGSVPADDAEGRAQLVEELRAVAEGCRRTTGKLLPYVGTINASRDLDVLRRALGDRKLNYFGISYGTRLGAVYAAQFPRRTGRMVLDAVDSLTADAARSAFAQATAFQKALDTFLSDCAARGARCPLGASTARAAGTLDATVARLERAGAKTASGADFTSADLRTALTDALYAEQLWPTLARGIAALHDKGDPALLEEITRQFAGKDTRSGRTEDDNSREALLAVNCADDPVRAKDPAAELASLEARFAKASPMFGPEQAGAAISCTGWPAGTDFIRSIHRTGAPPALLIGTRGDPATPYPWAAETARRLGKGVVLTYEGEGHGGYTASQCVRDAADAFLLDGVLPAAGTSCARETPPQR
ncbi:MULTISPECIES: alpha/beta hydrolase [unclassified Streptomyces]|uniref:alpha/beta hydrolase n=1 Tax=unclassified Streptomyces TaxID=2593676 RepID=UPI0033C02D4D